MATADGVEVSSAGGEEKAERFSVNESRFARTHSAVDTSNGGDRGWSLLKKAVRPHSAKVLSGSEVGLIRNGGLGARWQEFKAREKSSDFKAPASWPVPPRGSFFLRRSLDKLAERAAAGGVPDAGDVRSSGGDVAVNTSDTFTKLSSTAAAAHAKKSDVAASAAAGDTFTKLSLTAAAAHANYLDAGIVNDSGLARDAFTKLSSTVDAPHAKGSDVSIEADSAVADGTYTKLSSTAEAAHAKGSDLSIVAHSAASGQLTEPAPEPGLESDHNEEIQKGDSQHDGGMRPEVQTGRDPCNQDAPAAGTNATAIMATTESHDLRSSIDYLAKGSCNQDATAAGTHATAMMPKAESDNLQSGIEEMCEDACNQDATTAGTHATAAMAKTESLGLRNSIDITMRSSVQSTAASAFARHSTSASLGDVIFTSAPKGRLLDGHAGQRSIHNEVQEHGEKIKPGGEDDAAGPVAQRTNKLGVGRLMVNVSTFSAAGARARLAKRKEKEGKGEGVGMSEKEQAAEETAESTSLSQESGTATHLSDAVSGLAADNAIAAEERSEDDFNVFGERDDTKSRLRERVLELEKSRGVTVFKSSARARLGKRQQMRETRKTFADKVDEKAEYAHEAAQAVSTVALVANLLGFAGYNSIPEEEDEEGLEEVHNAWGDEDTSENLQQRTLEFEEARGLTMAFQKGPAKTNARARLAKKKQRLSSKQEQQFPGERTEPHGSECDEEFDPWGEDDTPEKKAQRLQELENGRILVNMPTFSAPEAADGRKRLAKRRQKGNKDGNVGGSETQQAAMEEPESTNTSQETGTTTISGAAALVANVFAFAAYNPFGETHEADEGPEEEHNAWGEADTDEKLHQRTLELEQARGLTMTYPTSPAKTNARARLAQKIRVRARATKNQDTTLPDKNNDQYEDGSAEKAPKRTQELEAARRLVRKPAFQPGHTETNKSRDRLAKKKQKAKTAMNIEEASATASADTTDFVTDSNEPLISNQPGYFDGFSRLFFGDAEYDDFDEEWNMWGEADSDTDYLGRVAAFEDARKLIQQNFPKPERSPRLDNKQHTDISNSGASAALASVSDTTASQAEGAPPAKIKHAMKKFQLPVRAIDRMKRRA